MNNDEEHQLTVEENHYRFLWGLVTFVSLSSGAVLFEPLQNSASFTEEYGLITLISLLFTLGIWGLYKSVQPIYRVFFRIRNGVLHVNIYFGEDKIKDYDIPLQSIQTITYKPRTPPGRNEALYDFATDYFAIYRSNNDGSYHSLIDIAPEKMALKIKDITEIIRFLQKHRSTIHIPEQDRPALGI